MADSEPTKLAEEVKPELDPNAPPPEASQEEGDLGRDASDDHEVVHSDESTKEDAKAISRVNNTLIGLAILGFAVTLGTIIYILGNFESTPDALIEEPPPPPIISLSGDLYYTSKNDSGSAEFYDISEEKKTLSFTAGAEGRLQNTDDNRNRSWQISRDGGVIAYQLSGADTVTVKNSLSEEQAFSDTNGQIQDWILTTDGRYVFGLFNGNRLIRYDINAKTSLVVDPDFSAGGGGQGRIYFGLDGSIRWFRFNGNDQLTTIVNYVGDPAEADPIVINSPRFPANLELMPDSLSPDGQGLVFRYTNNGRDFLGLASLNSMTVRTIYEGSNNSGIADFIWAPDSRTLAIAESQGGGVARIVKLDTGPLTKATILDRSSEGLSAQSNIVENISFTPDSKTLTFINGQTLYGLNLEEGSISSLLENIDRLDDNEAYGWINSPGSS